VVDAAHLKAEEEENSADNHENTTDPIDPFDTVSELRFGSMDPKLEEDCNRAEDSGRN